MNIHLCTNVIKKFYSLYPAIVIIHMSDYQAKLYR